MLGRFLNQITMYRLMLYFLLGLWVGAVVLAFTEVLPYNFLDILLTGVYLVGVCNLANYLLAKVFKARTNLESASITALILTLIVGPLAVWENIIVLTFIGVFAMAAKYILAIRKKHIFNPAASAVLLSVIFLNIGASWWIGSKFTLPLIILGGVLVLAKTKRYELVGSFLVVYFFTLILSGGRVSIDSFTVPAIWFFVLVMLVEPLTSPATKNRQIIFGAVVAAVYFLLQKIIPGYNYGLETSLVVGNLLNLALSPAFNMVLVFKKKEEVVQNIWQFYFEPMSKFEFTPGQYLEWTYPHKNPDSRGVRRYFTISSAPEEGHVTVTMRVAEKGSSFKSALMNMNGGEELTTSGPQGDFVLPEDKSIPIAFIAGGIGVTPFRSMVKSMLSQDEKRDIMLLYANSAEGDIAFRDLFEKAKDVGVKTFYIDTKKEGHIDEPMIEEKVPDYKKRVFFVSGPEPMVEAIKKMLSGINVGKIKTDFFPGYTE